MRKAFIAAAVALVLSACATDPDTICFDDLIYVTDVYGTGKYTEYREEFERENECSGVFNCGEAELKIRRCVENVEFK